MRRSRRPTLLTSKAGTNRSMRRRLIRPATLLSGFAMPLTRLFIGLIIGVGQAAQADKFW